MLSILKYPVPTMSKNHMTLEMNGRYMSISVFALSSKKLRLKINSYATMHVTLQHCHKSAMMKLHRFTKHITAEVTTAAFTLQTK